MQKLQSIENFIVLSNIHLEVSTNLLLFLGNSTQAKQFAVKTMLGRKVRYKEPSVLEYDAFDCDIDSPYYGEQQLSDFFIDYNILKNNKNIAKAETLAKEIGIANGIPRSVLISNIPDYDYVLISDIDSIEALKGAMYTHNSKLIVVSNIDNILSKKQSQDTIIELTHGAEAYSNGNKFTFTGKLIIMSDIDSIKIKDSKIHDKDFILQEAKRILKNYAIGVSYYAIENTIALFNELKDKIPNTDFNTTNIVKMALVYENIGTNSSNMFEWKAKVLKFLKIS